MNKDSDKSTLEQRVKYLEIKLKELREQDENRRKPGVQDRYEILAEAAIEGIFILENGYCIEANKSGCEMFGYSYEEFIGLHVTSVFAPEYWEFVNEKILNQDLNVYEAIALRKDGSTFIAEIKGRSFLFQGRMARVSTVIDITRQKQVEFNLKESETKYRSVIENAADGILLGNERWEIIEVNNSFLRITGYEISEIISKHIGVLFDASELKEKPLRFDLLSNGQSVIIEREIIGKNGERIPMEMNFTRYNEKNYLAVFRDLRERKKAKKDLRRANKLLQAAKEKAEESDRLKSAFLANMSHEIRTPLNGIVGFADLLRNSDFSETERADFIDIIAASGQQLQSIINDVLTISRIETGQVVIRKEPVDLAKLMDELHLFFRQVASDSHNQLHVLVPDDAALIDFEGDATRIRQIMSNLIYNALKFTWDGKVTFGFNYKGSNEVQFFVKDTGVGIPQESLSTIFDRFVQAENQQGVNQTGTGLGLAICKKLVELMGGKIWVESIPGEGSTFHFTLPYQALE